MGFEREAYEGEEKKYKLVKVITRTVKGPV